MCCFEALHQFDAWSRLEFNVVENRLSWVFNLVRSILRVALSLERRLWLVIVWGHDVLRISAIELKEGFLDCNLPLSLCRLLKSLTPVWNLSVLIRRTYFCRRLFNWFRFSEESVLFPRCFAALLNLLKIKLIHLKIWFPRCWADTVMPGEMDVTYSDVRYFSFLNLACFKRHLALSTCMRYAFPLLILKRLFCGINLLINLVICVLHCCIL